MRIIVAAVVVLDIGPPEKQWPLWGVIWRRRLRGWLKVRAVVYYGYAIID
jgi:hypothetical protein